MLYWTRRAPPQGLLTVGAEVVEEFWAQGDEELRLDIEVGRPKTQPFHTHFG